MGRSGSDIVHLRRSFYPPTVHQEPTSLGRYFRLDHCHAVPYRLFVPPERKTEVERMRTRYAAILLALVATAPAADRIPTDRPSPRPCLTPKQALEKMTVPPGFTVELVASEPDSSTLLP
jgi:hypothetical protein